MFEFALSSAAAKANGVTVNKTNVGKIK